MTLTSHNNPQLFSHSADFQSWFEKLTSGQVAHGWIISGPKGIGKATLAHHMARAALSGNPSLSPDDSVFRRVASGAHADFMLVEPAFDEKKGEEARSISVEQAREVSKFLSLTPAESKWRVVIVDSVDQLNNNAANSLLKILEEPPPQALLLLVSHNPGSLLPTIRSRCSVMKLSPLSGADFRHVMGYLHPDLIDADLTALHILSGGSPGLSASYIEQGALEFYDRILDVMLTLPSPDALAVHQFAEWMSAGKIHSQFQLFSDLILCLLARTCKLAAGLNVAPMSEREEGVLNKLSNLHPADRWATKWQQAQEQFLLASNRHLDYKQLVIIFFHTIATADHFQLSAAA